MDLAADLAELPLDRRVHVLVGGVDLFDRRQPLGHLCELGVGEDAGGLEALRVQKRPLEVVGEQLGVVRMQEVPDLGAELRVDPAGPQRHIVQPSSARSLRASVMSLIFTASWPMRSVGGERGCAALHAQPFRAVAERVAARVEDRVVVAPPELDLHLSGDDRGDPALQRVAEHQRLDVVPATLVEQPAEPPAFLGVALQRRFVVDRTEEPFVRDLQREPCPAPRRCRGSSLR